MLKISSVFTEKLFEMTRNMKRESNSCAVVLAICMGPFWLERERVRESLVLSVFAMVSKGGVDTFRQVPFSWHASQCPMAPQRSLPLPAS